MEERPIIISALLDPDSFRHFTVLRNTYFPVERNYLDAHITLFHHLPGKSLDEIKGYLNYLVNNYNTFAVQAYELKFTGRGVMIMIDSRELTDLRNQIASRFEEWLTPQDRQGYRPHITIQNKVTSEIARKTYDELNANYKPIAAIVSGLSIYHYDNGPWEHEADLRFPKSNK